ncbi:MAG TPA: 4-hydroxy-tetrahydrodipicolinate reductase [Steroidobacteraceae bacterium]|nr:4-hydroxy-tetrahydrodipicolinate reductase [Steroidobacteraceae bacterium]
MSAPRAVLIGASGRMGRQIVRELAGSNPGIGGASDAAATQAPLRLVGAVASAASRALGADAGVHADTAPLGVRIAPVTQLPQLLADADVALDFSRGASLAAHLTDCIAARVPLLIGTTGAAAGLEAQIDAAAHGIAVLIAPNTSLAVNVLLDLVRRAAQALPEQYDIEIVETHHRHKLDAPSGTALALGAAAVEGRAGPPLHERAVYGRSGHDNPRVAGQISFASLRGGDVVGEHQVRLLGPGESLELVHRATDRAVFARGAILAAAWLAGRSAGRYAMKDFLSDSTKA